MEDSQLLITTDSGILSGVTHRHSLADVPDGIEDELMLHFNDLNWVSRANSSTLSISTDSIQLERRSKATINTNVSSGTDTKFRVSSWHIPDLKADFSSDARQTQWVYLLRHLVTHFAHLLCFIRDSPYPEVRAAVSNTDDPTMIVNTFRV